MSTSKIIKIKSKVYNELKGDLTKYCYILNTSEMGSKVSVTKFKKYLTTFKVSIDKRAGAMMVHLNYTPYEIRGNTIVISRFMIFDIFNYLKSEHFKPLLSNFKFSELGRVRFKTGPSLWPEKRKLVNTLVEQLKSQKGATLLLDTGKGKTVILSEIIYMMKRHTCIICKNVELANQMTNDIMENLNLDEESVACIGGGRKYNGFDARKKVYVIVINSAKKIPLEHYQFFDLAAFDEAHSFCAEGSSKFMRSMPTQHVLALSATITKEWNWKVIVNSCGRLINGDNYVSGVKFDADVEAIRYYGPREYTEKKVSSANTVNVSYMVKQFNQDPYRTSLVIQKISELVDEGHDVIVFSCSVDQVDDLWTIFRRHRPDIHSGKIHGGVTAEMRVLVKKNCKVIFYNYQCGSTGLNLPRLTAMVLASPFADIGIQVSGRILRGKDNSIRRKYVDIIDQKTTLRKQYDEKRKPLYGDGTRQFDIEEKIIKYEDIELLDICAEVCMERTEWLIENDNL